MGAWIEIISTIGVKQDDYVAPLVGAWIEIKDGFAYSPKVTSSLLSWERGLKSAMICNFLGLAGRSSRGSVD